MYYYYSYDVHRAHEAAYVFDGPARAVARDTWCTTATTTSFLGVPGSLSVKNRYVRTVHSWQITSGVS